jgi:heme/copper-type cytochrome/quinol oxidase subunit 2
LNFGIALINFFNLGTLAFIVIYGLHTTGKYYKFTSSNILEFIWTVLPAVFILFLIMPTLILVYSTEEDGYDSSTSNTILLNGAQ